MYSNKNKKAYYLFCLGGESWEGKKRANALRHQKNKRVIGNKSGAGPRGGGQRPPYAARSAACGAFAPRRGLCPHFFSFLLFISFFTLPSHETNGQHIVRNGKSHLLLLGHAILTKMEIACLFSLFILLFWRHIVRNGDSYLLLLV